MAEATTGGTATLESKSVPIDLGSNRTGVVFVPGDIANRFNVTGEAGQTGGMVLRKRKGYTLQVYASAVDTTGTPKTVEAAEWYEPARLSGGGGGGRSITFPTGLTTPRGTKRMATLRFPGGATNAVISDWLFTTLVANKPDYFKTESGTRYAVTGKGAIPDLNPGNDPPATNPAPATGQ